MILSVHSLIESTSLRKQLSFHNTNYAFDCSSSLAWLCWRPQAFRTRGLHLCWFTSEWFRSWWRTGRSITLARSFSALLPIQLKVTSHARAFACMCAHLTMCAVEGVLACACVHMVCACVYVTMCDLLGSAYKYRVSFFIFFTYFFIF